jgi:hypothetical protein
MHRVGALVGKTENVLVSRFTILRAYTALAVVFVDSIVVGLVVGGVWSYGNSRRRPFDTVDLSSP